MTNRAPLMRRRTPEVTPAADPRLADREAERIRPCRVTDARRRERHLRQAEFPVERRYGHPWPREAVAKELVSCIAERTSSPDPEQEREALRRSLVVDRQNDTEALPA